MHMMSCQVLVLVTPEMLQKLSNCDNNIWAREEELDRIEQLCPRERLRLEDFEKQNGSAFCYNFLESHCPKWYQSKQQQIMNAVASFHYIPEPNTTRKVDTTF
jgi:Tfp pilus assembly pilus retraction ATPase PilT